jgi:asparagine synthase (glutamine-hydrolysing)
MSATAALLNHLAGAALRALRRQNALAVATSGGLDSSVLAALIARHAEIPVTLVSAAAPGADDGARARILARHLRLPLIEVVLSARVVEGLLDDVLAVIEPEPVDPAQEWGLPSGSLRMSPVRVGVALVLLACARTVRPFAHRLVLGQGADELFAGYARYQALGMSELQAALAKDLESVQQEGIQQEARIARSAGVQFQYPYLDPRVVALARTIAPQELFAQGERKPILRAVARALELPAAIADAPKTAAQYGSGVAALIAQLVDRAGVPQNDFLTQRAVQRKTGEPHSLRT